MNRLKFSVISLLIPSSIFSFYFNDFGFYQGREKQANRTEDKCFNYKVSNQEPMQKIGMSKLGQNLLLELSLWLFD